MNKETPCVAICVIDPKAKLCFGCGRTLQEIARWGRMESAERLSIMATLETRMTEAGFAPPSTFARKSRPATS
ncbi:MAG: Fe-S oxidoreductase [Bradyrhizobiaceae bacterium PARB1]|nr:MAG: Fe-S oxidoreductase [Bradyrhizobiaceae bacterium PARB1]